MTNWFHSLEFHDQVSLVGGALLIVGAAAVCLYEFLFGDS